MSAPAASRPVLVIDTTGRWCAAALKAGGKVFERHETMERGQAERLAPLVGELLAEAGLHPRDLARIGVATGPGSFAGTRAGTAFARGLALPTGARALGIPSLAALAHEADPACASTVFAAHDARRGELVWQIVERGVAQGEPARTGLEDARDALAASGACVITGSGSALLGGQGWREHAPLGALLALCELAPDDAPLPSPLYARPPDAALPGGIVP